MHFRCSFRFASTNPVTTSKQLIDELYSEDEKQKLLDCFNKCSPDDLQFTKHLSAQKSLAVVQYRENNGPFTALSELLRVQGLGILGLQKLCSALKTMDHKSLQELKEKACLEKVKTTPPFPKYLVQVCRHR